MIKVEFGGENRPNAELSQLLKISNINVPNNLDSSTHELVNRSAEPPSTQGVRNLNMFAYQPYDKPSMFFVDCSANVEEVG